MPAGTAPGTHTNTTGPISVDDGGSPLFGGTATDDLTVEGTTSLAPPDFTKVFTIDPVAPGGTTNLEFTIDNTVNPTLDATGISFTDNLPGGLTLAGSPPSDPCGPGSAVSGTSTLNLSGGNLTPGSSCTFSVDLEVPASTAPGTHTNTTGPISVDDGGSPLFGGTATDDLTVEATTSLAPPDFTKVFTIDPVAPGGTTNLEFTIDNTINPTLDATGISFTDSLPGGLTLAGSPPSNPCGPGSAVSGTSTLNLTGGNLTPGSSCTFSVDLEVPAGTAPGTHTNTTGPISVDDGGSPLFGGTATDDLTVEAPPGLSFEIPALVEVNHEANNVEVPLGLDSSVVIADIVISGMGTGQATASSSTRTRPEDVVDGDLFIVDSFFDVFFDITIVDNDPVRDFDPALGTEIILNGIPSTLFSSGPCTADTSKVNFGCIPQFDSFDWDLDGDIPLDNGGTLSKAPSVIDLTFSGQSGIGAPALIFEDGFESGMFPHGAPIRLSPLPQQGRWSFSRVLRCISAMVCLRPSWAVTGEISSLGLPATT